MKDITITEKYLANLRYSKQRTGSGNPADYRWDAYLKGFGVRVHPSGNIAYCIGYRNSGGAYKIYFFAHYPHVSVKDARELAHGYFLEIAKGNDPKRQRQELRQEKLFQEYAEDYLAYKKEIGRKSAEGDRQRLYSHIVPHIGKLRLSEIVLADLRIIQKQVKENFSPSTANRITALLKHLFKRAILEGLLTSSPAANMELYAEPSPRDIVLSEEQCGRLLQAIRQYPNPIVSSLFQFAFYTGRRMGELIRAKWADLNADMNILTLPDTKANERQYVYLNEQAEQILKDVRPHSKGEYIFTGHRKGTHITGYSKPWAIILVNAGLPFFPPHGLRHNYVSLLMRNTALNSKVIGALVGHKDSKTTEKYMHHRPEYLAQAANQFKV